MYQADNGGLEKAFNYRLACVREPDRIGYHQQLIDNQIKFFNTNPLLEDFVREFSVYVERWFSDIDDLDNELIKYAQQPHPKRKLRLRALQSLLDQCDLFHATFNRKVTGKVKKAELAKYLKATRLINDLTCEGSLLAGFVTDQLKKAMALFTKDRWFQFIKSPNLDDLKSTFDNLLSPAENLFFAFFSDDSCVSIRCADGVFMANVDISSCDGSHTRSVFDLLRKATCRDKRLHRFIDGAIKQCELPLTLRCGGTGVSVKVKPCMPVLYSGSTLTTLINNFANIAIAMSIKTSLRDDLLVSECSELVRTAAEAAGYIVTVQDCKTYHSLQFLKHSPCRAACGTMVPVLNVGVLLRSSGNCWGDLPSYKSHGKLTFDERAFLYNVSQTQCYKNCVSYGFLAAMRRIYAFDSDVERPSYDGSWMLNNITGDYSRYYIPADELATRYGLSGADMEELSNSLEVGKMSLTKASRAILGLDYGLE